MSVGRRDGEHVVEDNGEEYDVSNYLQEDGLKGEKSYVVPPPHLPLKRISSEGLRNLQIRRLREDEGKDAVQPSTDSAEHTDMSTPSSPYTLHRSSSFTHINQENRASFLRTSMSIPNLVGAQRAPYRNISAPGAFNESSSAAASLKRSRRNGTLWRDIAPESARGESCRSTLSSAHGNTWTERSSTLTDRSSSSEYPNVVTGWPVIREEDLSIEDVYGLYGDGFVDDDPVVVSKHTTTKPLLPSPLAPRHHHRPEDLELGRTESKTLPSASSPSILLSPPLEASTPLRLAYDNDDLPPTPRFPMTTVPYPARDRYGFKKESQHVTLKQYDAWNATYTPYLERRRAKWLTLMQQHNIAVENPTVFPPRSDKLKRYIRKGIPPAWRGAAWFYYAGGPAAVAKDPALYARLLARVDKGELSPDDREHIERDLHRTFPDNIKFKPDVRRPLDESSTLHLPLSPLAPTSAAAEPPMIASLRRVLQAYALHNPAVGYCQSCNFLAGFMLLFLAGQGPQQCEQQAFHLLCILTAQHLPNTHGPTLEGANVDIGLLMHLVQTSLPAVWSRIDDRPGLHPAAPNPAVATSSSPLPTISLTTTPWFMSAFVATLPVEPAARVWDALFYEGSAVLFRAALAVFRIAEPQLRRLRPGGVDAMEAFQVLQLLPRGLLDAGALMAVSLGGGAGKGRGLRKGKLLSQEVVDRKREERRALYAGERAAAAAAVLRRAATDVVGEGEGVGGHGERVLGDGQTDKGSAGTGTGKRLKRLRSRVGHKTG